MTRTPAFLALALLLVGADARARQTEPPKTVLKPSDREALSALFGDYFKARYENADLKAKARSIKQLQDDLAKRAKAAKLGSLLDSVADMRAAFLAPISPEKSPKKGVWQEVEADVELATGTSKVKFLLRLPKSYNPKTPVPLVLGLSPSFSKIEPLKKWVERAWPEAVQEAAALVVPENLTAIDWMSLDGRKVAFFALREAVNRYAIDRARIFADGQGPSAVHVVNYCTSYPGLFTGAIVREMNAAPAAATLANARQIPMLVITSGQGDPGTVSSAFAKDAEAAGVKVEMVTAEVAEDGKTADAASAAIAKFVTDSTKTLAPREIKFTTTSPQYDSAYWLALRQFNATEKAPITVEASVDRTKNEIVVSTPPEVTQFEVFLNQDLVDMGKPITVMHTVKNGDKTATTKRFEGTKKHNLDTALDIWFDNKSGNYGEVYTNSIVISVGP